MPAPRPGPPSQARCRPRTAAARTPPPPPATLLRGPTDSPLALPGSLAGRAGTVRPGPTVPRRALSRPSPHPAGAPRRRRHLAAAGVRPPPVPRCRPRPAAAAAMMRRRTVIAGTPLRAGGPPPRPRCRRLRPSRSLSPSPPRQGPSPPPCALPPPFPLTSASATESRPTLQVSDGAPFRSMSPRRATASALYTFKLLQCKRAVGSGQECESPIHTAAPQIPQGRHTFGTRESERKEIGGISAGQLLRQWI